MTLRSIFAAGTGGTALDVKAFGAIGDGVVEDRVAIQAALDAANAAGGGVVWVPRGTYLVNATLKIYSKTTLRLARHATIKRSSTTNCLIQNGTSGVGGYGTDTGITIEGGTWDGNQTAFPSNVCVIAFGHATDITIRDTTIKNVYGWHHVELNAVKTARVLNVSFRDYDNATVNKEALQLDLASGVSAFPWFGPYDNTACDDIFVSGCSFENVCRGIGSHSSVAGFPHRNVRIVGCHFKTLRESAVIALDYDGLVVTGCTMIDVGEGIRSVAADNSLRGTVVQGNVIKNIVGPGGVLGSGNRGIHFGAPDGRPVTNRDITVQGNTVLGGYYGISFDNCDGVGVVGNTVTGTQRHGSWAYGPSDVRFNSNLYYGNGIESTASYFDLFLGGGPTRPVTTMTITGNIVEAREGRLRRQGAGHRQPHQDVMDRRRDGAGRPRHRGQQHDRLAPAPQWREEQARHNCDPVDPTLARILRACQAPRSPSRSARSAWASSQPRGCC